MTVLSWALVNFSIFLKFSLYLVFLVGFLVPYLKSKRNSKNWWFYDFGTLVFMPKKSNSSLVTRKIINYFQKNQLEKLKVWGFGVLGIEKMGKEQCVG